MHAIRSSKGHKEKRTVLSEQRKNTVWGGDRIECDYSLIAIPVFLPAK